MIRMSRDTVNSPRGAQPSRRDVLTAAAAAALGGGLCNAWAQKSQPTSVPAATTQPTTAPQLVIDTPWWLAAERSRIVECRNESTIAGDAIVGHAVYDLVGQGLQTLADAASVEGAWRTILGDAKRVCVRFESQGGRSAQDDGRARAHARLTARQRWLRPALRDTRQRAALPDAPIEDAHASGRLGGGDSDWRWGRATRQLALRVRRAGERAIADGGSDRRYVMRYQRF